MSRFNLTNDDQLILDIRFVENKRSTCHSGFVMIDISILQPTVIRDSFTNDCIRIFLTISNCIEIFLTNQLFHLKITLLVYKTYVYLLNKLEPHLLVSLMY